MASTNTEYQLVPENIEYHTANSTKSKLKLPALSFGDNSARLLASSTERKTTTKRNLSIEKEEEPQGDTPRTIQRQVLAEAITTAMCKGLEPMLLAAKATKNKPTKYRCMRDRIFDGWRMLMKSYLEKAHATATPLDNAWIRVEFLENEARDYITNKSEAERDTDEKVLALLARRFGTDLTRFTYNSNSVHAIRLVLRTTCIGRAE